MKKTEYDLQAEDFLSKANTEMKIVFICKVKGFPNSDDKLWHNKYQVILSREGKQIDFPFYGSNHDYRINQKPSKYSILACVEKYEYPTDPWDFAREFGYEIKCKKDYNRVLTIAHECREQYEKLLDFFGENLMEELQEIN